MVRNVLTTLCSASPYRDCLCSVGAGRNGVSRSRKERTCQVRASRTSLLRLLLTEEHRGDFIVPQTNHTFNSYFHAVMYYKLILCCVHTLTDKSGIVLHKSDDAVVVLGIGIAYPSALYHFQRFQTDFYRFNPFAFNGGG